MVEIAKMRSGQFPRAFIGLAISVLAACGEGGGHLEISDNSVLPPPTCSASVWTARNSGIPNTLLGAGVFSGQAVAVGALGAIVTSADGITWTTGTSGITVHLNAVAASGTTAIAVGDLGTIISSTDLVTWTARTSGTANSLRGATWTGTQFVAVGDAGTILTTPDGITWTPQTSGTSQDLHAVAASPTVIVVVGGGSTVPFPPPPPPPLRPWPAGTTWYPRTSPGAPSTQPLLGVVWSGTQFLVVGKGGSTILQTSFDGITWTARTAVIGNTMFAAAWSGSEFMAVGQFGLGQRSPDGITWTSAAASNNCVSLSGDFNSVTWLGTRFISVGSGGTIYTAP